MVNDLDLRIVSIFSNETPLNVSDRKFHRENKRFQNLLLGSRFGD